jgi:HTH-type transcriptional regulator, bacterioopsin transcriptional activator and related proteins
MNDAETVSSVQRHPDAPAQPTSIQAQLAEVAARIVAESSTATIQAVLNQVQVPALVADTAGIFVAASPAAGELTGYSVTELRRLSFWDITAEADEIQGEQLWRAFIGVGEQRGDYWVRTKEGRSVVADYAARANVLPGLHLSILIRR